MASISTSHRPKTHIVVPDMHLHPDFHNDRADWLGALILDIKPDSVINIGDSADLPSLSTYDKGKASFHGRNYGLDIEAHLNGQERMWRPMFKSKKKLPRRVFLEGNHEHRIKRLLEFEPHLSGGKFGVSFNDLDLGSYYSDIVEYEGGQPGVIQIDGIDFAHFFPSGISGRPLQSIHHAYDLTVKRFNSSTVGHSHLLDWYTRRDSSGRVRNGLVCGVYQDYISPWAGSVCNHWTSGIVIKRNVEDGKYDLQHISIDSLRKEYGRAV